MSGSDHRDIPLADRLHMPWGISVVTCNIGPEDTSFAHHWHLPRVNSCHMCLITKGTYLN